jgi:hypothetical protein
VRRQIHRWALRSEFLDSLRCQRGGGGVWRYAVDRSAEHQVLRVGGVAREENYSVVLLDYDRQVAKGVAGRGNEMNITCLGQLEALWERPEGTRREVDLPRPEPLRPAVWQEAAQLSQRSGGLLQLYSGDEDLAVGKVAKAPSVIGVKMRHYDPADIGRVKAETPQGWTRLLVLLNPFAYAEAKVGVPAWEVSVPRHGPSRPYRRRSGPRGAR